MTQQVSTDTPVVSYQEKLELLFIARRAIKESIKGKPYYPAASFGDNLMKPAGAFVTLKKNGELRGCIGLIEAKFPLFEVVAEMAEKAAMSDPRFESVSEEEIDKLEIEISVLSPLKKVVNVEEIEVGRHGLVIEKGYYRGLLLPQVATENGWNREEFLQYTCIKAGLDKDTYKSPDAHLFQFSADVFGEYELGIPTRETLAERK